MIKNLFTIFFLSGFLSVDSQPSPRNFINPTGTYILKGESHKGEIRGNFAEIRIKLLEDSLLAITLYCNNGYPAYKAGAFTDTLEYAANRSVHQAKSDPSCQIVVSFDTDGLHINQTYTDPLSTCGLEKGVLPLGFIEKHSAAVPVIQLLSRLQ